MPDEQFRRNIAFKIRIGEILIGKPIFDNERFSFLELGNKRIVRVNIVGNIVEKFESEPGRELKYSFFTLDDGSGQIRLKCFGDDVEKFKYLNQGETVVVIGVLRNFNDETYISPEIIRETDPKYLLLRKMEIEKNKSENFEPVQREQMAAVRDRILRKIKNSEEDGGIEVDRLIMGLQDIAPVIINQEIQRFIEEGIVFEPRPGKVRYLG